MEPKFVQKSLFSQQADDPRQTRSESRKPKEFGKLVREFYSRLTNACMNYFLRQPLTTHLGACQMFPALTSRS